ncbi:MAG: DMT family transporter [Actinomycetota bacterium]|nr:MAG: DMT family transporter [Actinomycetota bacterium]
MPIVLALLCSLSWGTSDFLGGTLSRRRAALAVVGGSQAFGLAFMLLIASTSGSWSTDRGYVGWAILASVTGVGGLLCFYPALAAGTMGIVAPIAALGVLVPLAAGLLRGEAPGGPAVLGIVLAVAGVVLASGPELSGGAPRRPILLASAAAALFGLSLLALAHGSETSAIMTMTGMRITTFVFFLAVLLAVRNVGGLRPVDLPLLATTGLLDVLANLAYGLASTEGLLSIVSVLGSMYPVVTVVLAWWFHGERLRAVQYAGVGSVVAGIVLIAAGDVLG